MFKFLLYLILVQHILLILGVILTRLSPIRLIKKMGSAARLYNNVRTIIIMSIPFIGFLYGSIVLCVFLFMPPKDIVNLLNMITVEYRMKDEV